MSESGHCADCQRPVRMVRVSGWETGPKDGTYRIELDYVKSPNGEYAVFGPDTAKFIKQSDRAEFLGPLYTDHRRTCPVRKTGADQDRPRFAKIQIRCAVCDCCQQLWAEIAASKAGVEAFLNEHANCRRRKAS